MTTEKSPENIPAKKYVAEDWACGCALMDGEPDPYCIRCWGVGSVEVHVFKGVD